MKSLGCWSISDDDVKMMSTMMRGVDEKKITEEQIENIMFRFKGKVEWLLGDSWTDILRNSIKSELGVI